MYRLETFRNLDAERIIEVKFKKEYIICLVLIISMLKIPPIIYRKICEPENKVSALTQFLTEYSDEDDEVLIIGTPAYGYLTANRKCPIKYFYQDPVMYIDPNIEYEFWNQLHLKKPKVIVVPSTFFLYWNGQKEGHLRTYDMLETQYADLGYERVEQDFLIGYVLQDTSD